MRYKLAQEDIDAIERAINKSHKAEVSVEGKEVIVVDVHRQRIWPPKSEKTTCNPPKRAI